MSSNNDVRESVLTQLAQARDYASRYEGLLPEGAAVPTHAPDRLAVAKKPYLPKKPSGVTKLVQIHRHVRDGKIDPRTGKKAIASNGGVALYIEIIDRDVDPMIAFSWAIASDKETFHAKIGNDISRGRFEAGQKLVGNYQRDLSLVENCQAILAIYEAEYQEEYVTELQELPVDWEALMAVGSKLRRLTRRLPREAPPRLDAAKVAVGNDNWQPVPGIPGVSVYISGAKLA